jgi:hypothetical protein
MGSDVDAQVNGENPVTADVNAYRIRGTSPGELIENYPNCARVAGGSLNR